MTDQANNIKQSIGKVTPQVLGKMFKDYFIGESVEVSVLSSLAEVLNKQEKTAEILKVFDGGLV